jgi:hypothetical protein
MGRNSTSFQKGKSGNPNGRPPKTEEQLALETACKERTLEALTAILTIMKDGENERNRLAAAQFIIERGWGKTKPAVEVSNQGGEQLSIEVHYVDADQSAA